MQTLKPIFYRACLAAMLTISAAVPLLHSPAPAPAAIIEQINLQSRVTDPDGNIVGDGTYNMEFKLMTVASGGDTTQGSCTTSCVWIETRTSGNRVTISRGLMSIQLGSVSSLASVNFNQDLYLSIRVGGTGGSPTWDPEMSPRDRLGAAPTAIFSANSDQLNGETASYYLNAANLTGTLADARLSSNVPLKNASNDFSASQTISANGGKTTLALSNTGTNTGLTIGGDTNLYREGANSLVTDDAFSVNGGNLWVNSGGVFANGDMIRATRSATGFNAFQATIQGESNPRYVVLSEGEIQWGPGNASTDTNLFRSSANNLKTDDTFEALAYRANGSAGASTTCSGGQFLQNQVVVGGITTGGTCAAAGGSSSLQGAYDGGNTITTTDARDIDVTLANTSTDSNFVLDVASGSTSEFQVENNGTDVLQIGSAGQLQLDTQGSGGGLLLGGDANLYRAAADTLTGETVNATTGINTGASAGTQRIDASGNLVNIGNITGTGAINVNTSGFNIRDAGGNDFWQFGTSHVGTLTCGLFLSNDCIIQGGSSLTLRGATDAMVNLSPQGTGDAIVNGDANSNLQVTSTGKEALALTSTSTDTGLTLGGDANLYRSSANNLKSDDTFEALAFRANGSAGSTTTCSGGQFLQNQVVVGGITTGGTCAAAGGSGSLQGAYDGGNTITTTDARDLDVTLANTTTDSNFILDVATGSTSEFQVENNGTDVMQIGSAGQLQLDTTGSSAGILLGGDANLYRSAADTLKSDDIIQSARNLYARQGTSGEVNIGTGGTTPEILFGSAGDTNLYRGTTDTLQTDDQFRIVRAGSGNNALAIRVSGDTDNRFISDASGVLEWGPGNATADTNLYRSAADTLKTDDNLTIGSSDTTGRLLTLDVKTDAGDPTGADGAMYFNDSSGTFRCYQNGTGWTDCLGVPKPNTRRWMYAVHPGSGTTFNLVGDVATAGTAPTNVAATTSEPSMLNYATGTTSGNVNHVSGNTNYDTDNNILFQTYGVNQTTSSIRVWRGITNQTAATMSASANPAGNYAAFRFDTGAGDTNWQCITKDGTTQNIQSSGIAGGNTTGRKFEILQTSSSVEFKIDGAIVCTSTTNLPAANTLMRYVNTVTTLTAAAANLRTSWIYVESNK